MNQKARIDDLENRLVTDPKFAKMDPVTIASGAEKLDVHGYLSTQFHHRK